MKPVLIVKSGTMSAHDIKRLRANGLCVVESKEPAAIRFMEPAPPDFDAQQWAAIELSRTLITEGKVFSGTNYRTSFAAMYADILLRGDPLKRVPILESARAAA